MIKIKAINGSPETPLPQERFGSYFDGEFFNVFETQAEADVFYAEQPAPVIIEIDEVAAWRVRAALRNMGVDIPTLLANVKAMISVKQSIVLDEALNGNTIDKFHPLTDLVCQIANIDKNELWETAKNIDK